MIKRITQKSEFRRNIITLVTGTTIAQAIPSAISPILSRIYTPEEFGVFALYMSIVSIISVISTGRYELAIMLPRKDEYAFHLTALASFITLVVSILFFLIVLFFSDNIGKILKSTDIISWLYLIPISVLVSGLYQIMNFWHNRKKRYTEIAKNRILQSTGTASTQLSFYFIIKSAGLILGQLIGQLIALIYFVNVYVTKDKKNYKMSRIKTIAIARRYRKFPQIDVPTSFLNLAANQSPNILLVTLFSTGVGGFYYLTQRVLQAPITLISKSILEVFKQKASEDFAKKGHCREIYKKTFLSLLLITSFPSLILFFWVQDIFAIIFGEEWREAGEYAQLLIPALFFRFIANPMGFMFYIAEKQIWNLLTMICLFIGIMMSLFIAQKPVEAVGGISFSYSIYYFIHLVISAKLARVI